MAAAKKSFTHRRDDAMAHAEVCAASLLRAADAFSLTNKAIGDYEWMRRDLLSAARRYTRSMDAVSRLRA